MSLKNKVEAILYGVGKQINISEILKLLKVSREEALSALEELKKDYESRDTALMIVNHEDNWKLITKEAYATIVRRLVSEVELSKAVLETLSVIAWKQPVLQSEVIDIRSQAAYEHIGMLEGMGFILKEPFGRSYLIRVTDKFVDYFELDGGKDIRQLLEKARIRYEKKLAEKEREKKVLEEIKLKNNPKLAEEKKAEEEKLEKIRAELDELEPNKEKEQEEMSKNKEEGTKENLSLEGSKEEN